VGCDKDYEVARGSTPLAYAPLWVSGQKKARTGSDKASIRFRPHLSLNEKHGAFYEQDAFRVARQLVNPNLHSNSGDCWAPACIPILRCRRRAITPPIRVWDSDIDARTAMTTAPPACVLESAI
jgi:hypothetical protein